MRGSVGRRTVERRRRRATTAMAVVASMTVVASCAARPQAPTARPAPPLCAEAGAGEEVRAVDPAVTGLDADVVDRAIDYAVAKGAQSIRVYRHGCLVGDAADDPSMADAHLPAWSMTKGVVSMLVGRAVQMGLIDVDAPIGTYLPISDPRKAALTARQFLNQTTGLRMDWVSDLLDATGDSAARLLERPFEAVPGTTFLYAQTAVTGLVAVLEAAIGEDLQSFAQRELFDPIGIERDDWDWYRDGAGRSQGFAFLQMTPTAFGKLGRLLLQEGVWAGRRLLPASYIAEGRTGTTANPCYGFLWRNNDGVGCGQTGPLLGLETTTNWMPTVPTDAFAFAGMFDQLLVVIPSLDMVVVRLGLPPQLAPDPWGDVDGAQPSMTWRFFRTLMSGVTDADVADPGEWQLTPTGDVDVLHILPIPLPEPTW